MIYEYLYMENKEKERLKQLDKARKERHFAKKLENAPWIECGCGCKTKIKSIDSYGRPKKYINGHNNRKYDDPKEHSRVYMRKKRNDPKFKLKEQQKKKDFHHKRKVKLILLKGGKCLECGKEYDGTNAAIFQFHHRNPSDKIGRITFDWTWDKILIEAEKCNLVCACCHFLIHGDSY